MRVSSIIATSAALTSAASAAVLQARQYPACVGGCIQQEATAISCTVSDAPCLCNSEAFINQVAVCFADNCSASDADAGVKLGQDLCRAIGVSVTIPNAASAALASGASASHASTGSSGNNASQTSNAPTSINSSSTGTSTATSETVAQSTAPPPASASPTGAASFTSTNVAMAGTFAALGALITLLV